MFGETHLACNWYLSQNDLVIKTKGLGLHYQMALVTETKKIGCMRWYLSPIELVTITKCFCVIFRRTK